MISAKILVVGGADGWTWGGTCYIRHLFVPAPMRNQGHCTLLMDRIEDEAKARRCEQIVLETHDFQPPGFYRKRGFKLIAPSMVIRVDTNASHS